MCVCFRLEETDLKDATLENILIQDSDNITDESEVSKKSKGKTLYKTVTESDQVMNDVCAIAYVSCLESLAQMNIPGKCKVKGCTEEYALHVNTVGTAVYMKWVIIFCNSTFFHTHLLQWRSVWKVTTIMC